MKKLSIFVVMLLVSALSFSTINAQPLMYKMGPKFERGKFMNQLNLTDAQQKKFNQLRFDNQKKAVDLRALIQKKRIEIKEMMVNNEINGNKLLALTNNISDLQSKMKSSKVTMWLDIYNILNKDQQKLWVKHFNAMGNKMRKGMHENFMGRRGFKGMEKFKMFMKDRDND